MSWKLRIETDMENGEASRFFSHMDTGLAVPEDLALLLVKQIIKNFPEAIDALVTELNEEVDAPPAQSPPPVYSPPVAGEEEEESGWVSPQFQQEAPAQAVPQVPMVRQPQQAVLQQQPPQEQEPAHQPLAIPPNLAKTSGMSLKDFAPTPGGRERDTGQL